MVAMRNSSIVETTHEPLLGARTALSARIFTSELADMAVRAPVCCRFVVPMRDFEIVETFHESA
jgi:hypothetical protein